MRIKAVRKLVGKIDPRPVGENYIGNFENGFRYVLDRKNIYILCHGL